jgi:hypothetical protein
MVHRFRGLVAGLSLLACEEEEDQIFKICKNTRLVLKLVGGV